MTHRKVYKLVDSMLNSMSLEKKLDLNYRIEDAKKNLNKEDSEFLTKMHEANKPSLYQKVVFHLFGSYGTRVVIYEATKQILEERQTSVP